MDLTEVLGTNSLQQDEYSQSGVVFGSNRQLSLVGHDGGKSWNKYYILKCATCSQDSELFGEGYFRSVKSVLIKGVIPCGCSKSVKWSIHQYNILCSRKAKELGYTFLGFVGEWRGINTKIKMLCEKHGEWDTGNTQHLINGERGCPKCKLDTLSVIKRKPDDTMIQSFFDSGSFHPDTKFWRSDRLNSRGCKSYWNLGCPECGEQVESNGTNLQKGAMPCGCSVQQQQQCYIGILSDEGSNIAIKFGIAKNSKQRIKLQDRKSAYEVKQHSIYLFDSVFDCKKAERDCKQELECGIVLKRDMPDGYTETTWIYNLDKIIEIYERNGGVKIE